MGETPLSREKILGTACEALRRFGPAKTTVVDVARLLGVSHASVYRHFGSKSELRDAVVREWVDSMLPALEAVVRSDGAAPERLYRWLRTLIASKRSRAFDDPELFAAYAGLAAEAGGVVGAHMDDLAAQLAQIVAEGVERGELRPLEAVPTAWAILHATVRFQNPAHVAAWREPDIDAQFENVWSLLMKGLAEREEKQETK